MKIVFVVNNRGNRLDKVLHRLDQYFQDLNHENVYFISTLRKGHAVDMAKQVTIDGCDYLIAVGGDGTLHEVINGVMLAKIPTNNYPAIGLLPYGSANDFARTINASNNIDELFQLIHNHTVKKINLGKITLYESREERYFINIVGVGLSGEVVHLLESSKSFLGPAVNYFSCIIKGFFNYEKKNLECKGDNWSWQGSLLQLVVANGRYYGNGICIAPDADPGSGEFQVSIFGDLDIWDYLKNLGNLKKGKRLKLSEVSYYNSKEVTIKGRDSGGVEADGEFVGHTPVKITMLPKAINFLISNG